MRCIAAYLAAPVPLAARGRTRDAWLLVGAAGCGVALLLLLLALAGAALSQRSRAARRRRRVTGSQTGSQPRGQQHGHGHAHAHGHGAANRRRHFHGRDNKGFLPDDHKVSENQTLDSGATPPRKQGQSKMLLRVTLRRVTFLVIFK